jgi:hypothetical protein
MVRDRPSLPRRDSGSRGTDPTPKTDWDHGPIFRGPPSRTSCEDGSTSNPGASAPICGLRPRSQLPRVTGASVTCGRTTNSGTSIPIWSSRGSGGQIRRRKRSGTTVPAYEGHRRERRVRAHVESRGLGADMGRYRWSETGFLSPEASRGPGGRIRRRKRVGTTVPASVVHRRERHILR